MPINKWKKKTNKKINKTGSLSTLFLKPLTIRFFFKVTFLWTRSTKHPFTGIKFLPHNTLSPPQLRLYQSWRGNSAGVQHCLWPSSDTQMANTTQKQRADVAKNTEAINSQNTSSQTHTSMDMGPHMYTVKYRCSPNKRDRAQGTNPVQTHSNTNRVLGQNFLSATAIAFKPYKHNRNKTYDLCIMANIFKGNAWWLCITRSL